MPNPHVGDIGTVFTCTVVDQDDKVVDLSGATVKEILFKKPKNKGTLVKTASFSTNGTDGKLKYTTIAEDLDIAGDWKIQAYAENPDGNWHTDQEVFVVEANIKRA